MRRPNLWSVDAGLYLASALVAALALRSVVPVYRQWAAIAVGPYVVGAAAAFAMRRHGSPPASRRWLAGALLAAVTVVPVALEIAWGPHAAPVQHAESETLITEEAARALVHGHDPYATAYLHGPLAAWPRGTKTHYPYLPFMVVFGLPRAMSSSPVTDARVAFLVATLVAWLAAVKVARISGNGALLLLQALLVLPTGAVLLAGGGDDVVVVAIMVLAIACLHGGRTTAAGVFAGVAATMKQLAWPLLPFMIAGAVVAGRSARARVAASAAAVIGLAVVPFAIWNPSRFYEDVVRYPLGYGKPKTFHPTPTVGVAIARAFPHLRGAVGAVAAIAVVATTAWLLTRARRWSSRRVALDTAVVIAVGLVLAPASRLGFVVYLAGLGAWAVALRPETAARSVAEPAARRDARGLPACTSGSA